MYSVKSSEHCKLVKCHESVNANQLTSIPPEIIRKPLVFWWFQGEQKLINSLKFAQLETKFEGDLCQGAYYIYCWTSKEDTVCDIKHKAMVAILLFSMY